MKLTGTGVPQQERTQITHYDAGQRYRPHLDSLRASKLDPGSPGDRVCTGILHLNDDYEGGGRRSGERRRKRARGRSA